MVEVRSSEAFLQKKKKKIKILVGMIIAEKCYSGICAKQMHYRLSVSYSILLSIEIGMIRKTNALFIGCFPSIVITKLPIFD